MLTDATCKNAQCPPDKPRAKFSDSGGLYLEVSQGGARRWFWKYRKPGQGDKAGQLVEARMALGNYPAVSLAQARKARDAAKGTKAGGMDPVQARKAQKLATPIGGDTFKAIGMEWLALKSPGWSQSHTARETRNLEKDLFPAIGAMRIADITPMQVLAAVQKVEARDALEAARRVLSTARQVFRHWLPMAPPNHRNVTEGLLDRMTPRVKGHFPAIIEPVRFGGLLRAIDGYKGRGVVVKFALQLAPLLWQRPGNLRAMEWAHLDLDGALWTIPSADMKRNKQDKEHGLDHVVPMPAQAVALLRSIQALTGGGRFVFPGQRSGERPISDNSVRTALYSLGCGKEQSWHGFRASARTMMVDELGLDKDAIEANLAHAVKDANGRAYNRTQHLKQRFEQIQIWADYLDGLKAGNVYDMAGKPLAAAA